MRKDSRPGCETRSSRPAAGFQHQHALSGRPTGGWPARSRPSPPPPRCNRTRPRSAWHPPWYSPCLLRPTHLRPALADCLWTLVRCARAAFDGTAVPARSLPNPARCPRRASLRSRVENRHAHQRAQPDQRHHPDVTSGATTAHVRDEIAPGQIVTAAITNEAVGNLAWRRRPVPSSSRRPTDDRRRLRRR